MDPAKRRFLEDENSSLMKIFDGAAKGFVLGPFWSMPEAITTLRQLPRSQRVPKVTINLMKKYALCYAAIGGVYVGVGQLLEYYRMKQDVVNGTVSAFVAGATFLPYYSGNPRNIINTISYGSLLAMAHVFFFSADMKKRSSTDACA